MQGYAVKVRVHAACEIRYRALSRFGGDVFGVVRIEAEGSSEAEARVACAEKADGWIAARSKEWSGLRILA